MASAGGAGPPRPRSRPLGARDGEVAQLPCGPDGAARRQALGLLDGGLVVGFFPEGTRSRTGALGEAHPGVALVAVRSGAPILPVAITGTEALPLDAKAAGRAHRGRPRVRVTVGAPFHLPPRPPGEKQDLAAATERIMREIAALLPPAYRGSYGDEPAGRGARAEGRGARAD